MPSTPQHTPQAARGNDHAHHQGRHDHHDRHDHGHAGHGPSDAGSLNRTALAATLHCLAGCSIGEVAGLLIGNAMGWSNTATIPLAVALSFVSGLTLTLRPFLQRGYAFAAALRIALAADTASIAMMELVDNTVMLAVPGAMSASLLTWHFWGSTALSMALGGLAAFPLNRWLIARGKGHALAHAHH